MFLNLNKINKNKIAAWAVHGFTGSGAVLGFLAIIAILNSDAVGAFLWLGLALLIDGLDGTLARKVNVSEQTPNIDGTILDSVIDYLNYVIIPSLMIYWFGMVPSILEIILPAAIFLVSLYTFANLRMKTDDYYFRGFPAVWNIVVLYFFVLGTNEYINVAVIIICLILTFVPIKFVHPLRVKELRNLTIFFTIIWSATTLKLVTTPSSKFFMIDSTIIFILWVVTSIYFAIICWGRSIKDSEINKDDLIKRMDGAISSFNGDLTGLRTGRASTNMVDGIMIDAYGQKMPIDQVGSISVPEARMISIQVWDKGLVIAVEKAIHESGLGLNPQVDGELIRIPIPELNEERREELSKIAGKYAEQSRIAIRNVRRDGMDEIKKIEKDGTVGKDRAIDLSNEVQELTDDYIKKIDEMLSQKENEIRQV